MKDKAKARRSDAFTLIELLIVVAIVAILAAIAVPNFLEAQTRSKVSRASADMRSMATALEIYRVDWSNYPPSLAFAFVGELSGLTTPVPYITSIPKDPFLARDASGFVFSDNVYDYVRFRYVTQPSPLLMVSGDSSRAQDSHWFLISPGPDARQEGNYLVADIPGWSFPHETYDATNGTVSEGDIFRIGGGA